MDNGPVVIDSRETHIEAELRRIYDLLRASKMLRTALLCGAKADVIIYINNGRVVERGPHVREVA